MDSSRSLEPTPSLHTPQGNRATSACPLRALLGVDSCVRSGGCVLAAEIAGQVRRYRSARSILAACQSPPMRGT